MESAASHKPNLPPPPPVDDNPQPKQDGDKVESSSSGDEIVKASRRSSGASSSDGSELDLELGVVVQNEISDDDEEVHLSKVETRDCRICHLSLDEESGGLPIELGCSCKDDLAASHRHCAEAWFKIKGNKNLRDLWIGSTKRGWSNRGGDSSGSMERGKRSSCCGSSSSSNIRKSTSRVKPSKTLLARASFPKLPTGMHGICICYILALPLQCPFLECNQIMSSLQQKKEAKFSSLSVM
ncbi:hypothetical protein LINPERPRIM_LOCUS9543 [Linum perenne]